MANGFFRSVSFRLLPLKSMVISIMVFTGVYGGEPRYMRMDFEKVPALEIKGEWDADNSVFIAERIEELPRERRPKFRGEIQKIDSKNETITIYGILIEIDDETQFSDSEGDFKALKVGQQVEVSCKVRDNGWEASKIKLKDIKKSDKIKGTVTRISVDGEPPDTLEIHDLKIILTRKTKIVEPGSYFEEKEDVLFDDLKASKLYYEPGGAEISDRIKAYAEYRHTAGSNTEFDLSGSYEGDNGDTEPEIRLEVIGNYDSHFQSFMQFRLRKKYYYSDERGNPPPNDLEADITQLYLLARNIENRGFALQVGRQDFDEPREWLFDEYLDAVRAYYYGINKFIFDAAYIRGISPIRDKYETWTDFFWQARWLPDGDNLIGIFALMRKDGDKTRGRQPIWHGARYYGNITPYIKLWAEGSLMNGEDKGRSLDAGAIDLGLIFTPPKIKFSPSITAAYTLGTGDRTGGDIISNEFRQTGYQDNTDYFGGYKTIRYYGELLDPELSNLIIRTLGAGIKPHQNISAEMIYHKYKQDHPDDKLCSDLIDPPARPNNVSDDIGWELDLVIAAVDIRERISLSWVSAIFSPGQAFAPRLENALLNRFNIKIDL